MYAYAALLALSVELYQHGEIWIGGSRLDLQSVGPAPERTPATTVLKISYSTRGGSKQNRPDAVRMMLPPPKGFPRASFVRFIAVDACFTARKQLVEADRVDE
jgi:hypothetical protein